MNMKQIFLVAMVAAAGMTFGAVNDTILTFGTKGPDKYFDGKPVVDGESYALVWTPNGSTFGGFAADGTLLSEKDKLVLVAGLARKHRCPTTLFEISADDAEQYKGGTFALYLLDTRVKDAAGEPVAGAKGAVGTGQAGVAVNAAGLAASGNSGSSGALSIGGGAIELAKVGVHTEIAAPSITAFEVKGANVTLTVEGMEPTADYFVVPGSTPSKFMSPVRADRKDETLSVKKADGETFFKVIGVRKFE